MELEEMKTKWTEMSAAIESQKRLTDNLVIKMIRSDYRRKINQIRIPELIGAVVCAGLLLYIMVNFHKLNNEFLTACGLISILILGVLPVLSLRAISKMNSLNVNSMDYKELLARHLKAKLHFIWVQKTSLISMFVLVLVCLPVFVKLMGGTHIRPWPAWVGSYALCFVISYFVATKVYRRYKRSADEAGEILKDLS